MVWDTEALSYTMSMVILYWSKHLYRLHYYIIISVLHVNLPARGVPYSDGVIHIIDP